MVEGYVIRQAEIHDLDEIANLEKVCFLEEEAASKMAFFDRLSIYANHFWLLVKDGHIISMVNGMVTDDKDLHDEMYHNAELHNEQGKWQMIFGVETHPEYENQGYAAILINKMIEDAKSQGRRGVVLTCKKHLIHYYKKFGFENEGISASEHGAVVWYQMRLKLSGKYSNMREKALSDKE